MPKKKKKKRKKEGQPTGPPKAKKPNAYSPADTIIKNAQGYFEEKIIVGRKRHKASGEKSGAHGQQPRESTPKPAAPALVAKPGKSKSGKPKPNISTQESELDKNLILQFKPGDGSDSNDVKSSEGSESKGTYSSAGLQI